MSPKQKKIAAKAPPKNKIDAKDFAVLKAEKAKGRGMGLQDEKVKPGKVQKAALGAVALGLGAKKLKEKGKLMPLGLGAAMMKKDKMKEILGRSKGGESKSDKVKRAFPKKSPSGRAKIETMLGSKYTPMKKERLFEGDKARRRESLKKLLKNVRKAIPGVGMLDVKVTKKSKGGGADTRRKRKTPERPRGLGKLGGSKSKKEVVFTTDKSFLKDMKPPTGAHPGKFNKGGGADMGTKMSDKRKRRFKQILERLKSPTTINIKSEYKPGTRSPMQRDRKREGYRAKVESKGGKVLFMDEMKKGGSVMARGCKLGRKKTTKLY